MRRLSCRLLIALLALATVASACGGGDDSDGDDAGADSTDADSVDDDSADEPEPEPEPEAEPEPEPEPEDDNPLGALRVPEDFATVQEAVDAAAEGDLILIGPGVYNESVVVETDSLVIRGTDRNEVILDGEHREELANGFIVFSNGVAIENLTVRNYYSNGIFFTGDYDTDFILHGYRASYITALNNRKYGIYAFNTEYGLMEDSYASGHTDSGFYVGQCQPCKSLLIDNVSEKNTLGYSGTNAGGELYIVANEFGMNRVGIVPNTLDSEELAPQRDAVFAGNWAHDNGNPNTPLGGDIWELAFGIGIVLPGTNDNLILRNLVENNSNAGIAVSFMPDENVWIAEDNEIRDNVMRGNLLDAVMVAQQGTDTLGNCWSGNTLETSMPADIQTVAPCGEEHGPVEDMVGIDFFAPPGEDANLDYTLIPVPGAQPSMPDALTAPPVTAEVITRFDEFDLDAILVPTGA